MLNNILNFLVFMMNEKLIYDNFSYKNFNVLVNK